MKLRSIAFLVFIVAIAPGVFAQEQQDVSLNQVLQQVADQIDRADEFAVIYQLDRIQSPTADLKLFDQINPGFWLPQTMEHNYSKGKYAVARRYLAANMGSDNKYGPPVEREQHWIFDGTDQYIPQLGEDGEVSFVFVYPLEKMATSKGVEAPISEVNYLFWAGICVPNSRAGHAHPKVRSSLGALVSENADAEVRFEKLTPTDWELTIEGAGKQTRIRLDSQHDFAITEVTRRVDGKLTERVLLSNFRQVQGKWWVPEFCEIERFCDRLIQSGHVFSEPIFHESASLVEISLKPKFPENHFEFTRFEPGTLVADGNLTDRVYRIPGSIDDFNSVVSQYRHLGKQGDPKLKVTAARLGILVGLAGCCWLIVQTRKRRGQSLG